MGGTSVFDRHPKKTLAMAGVVALVAAAALAEAALRAFLPTSLTVDGFVHTANGALYGWGFDAHQVIRRQDPDTGAVFIDRANSRGWRDKERTFDNPNDAYRIVVVGDSHTFGHIVPAEAVYTRVLEERLRADGINAEVINIAVPAWGTDQAYEALRLEGLRYSPDLVIMQFTLNDLRENLRYRNPGKIGRRHPFYYAVNKEGALERHANPRFAEALSALTRRTVLSTSQVLTRLWNIRDAVKAWSSPRHTLGEAQMIKIAHALGLAGTPAVMTDLRRLGESGMAAEEIAAVLARHGLGRFEEAVLRIAEKRWFNERWTVAAYEHEVDAGEGAWRLYFALLDGAQRLARDNGARFAVLSTHETGLYEWDRYWYAVAPGAERKAEYLAPTRRIRAFALEKGFGFVDNVHVYVRSRNNEHVNVAGNAAIAEDVYLYLMREHAAEMDRHRRPRTAAREHSEGGPRGD